MDLLIQKATELGVRSFLPVITRYCAQQRSRDQQLKRWQRIMLEACKQCRRPIPMQICPPTTFKDLPLSSSSNHIMPWEQEIACSLSTAVEDSSQPVFLLVGPEGGFHPTEVTEARKNGFRTVSLGPRILRAETAALAAVSLIQQATGNLASFPGQPSERKAS